MRLEETLKERSPRARLERACRPLAVLGRRASAPAFPYLHTYTHEYIQYIDTHMQAYIHAAESAPTWAREVVL